MTDVAAIGLQCTVVRILVIFVGLWYSVETFPYGEKDSLSLNFVLFACIYSRSLCLLSEQPT